MDCSKICFTLTFALFFITKPAAVCAQQSPHRTNIKVELLDAGKHDTAFRAIPLSTQKAVSNGNIYVYRNEFYQVKIQEQDRGGFSEIIGELEHLADGDAALTVRVSIPVTSGSYNWHRGLDQATPMKTAIDYFDTIPVSTVLPPDGAYNGNTLQQGGYGDPVGAGTMSFYPLAAISSGSKGYALGIDLSIPLVYRLGASVKKGLFAELDLATSPLTKKFPGRAFFRLSRFDFDGQWGMRSALEKYYSIYPDAFKKRAIDEGIWLPFTPLRSIPNFEDFGIVFHETSWTGMDEKDGVKLPNILSDKGTAALSFQYTEPWDVQIPLTNKDLSYAEVTADNMIPGNLQASIRNSATYDKNGKWQVRRLKTPWFRSGWAMSITTNCDPDLAGINRYEYVMQDEIKPALQMNVDGIYFDSMEWNWHHDLNYRQSHFADINYPLTFSKTEGRPAIWNFASEYAMMNKVANEMHAQGKLVMGNGHGWNPFAAANLDLFGAELSWYYSGDHDTKALDFKRAISFQKPIVFLLNEGLNDTAFTRAPYTGYRVYFEKLMAYGFFPSFFSVDASSDPYWQDKEKVENGRPFFKKYITIIKKIAAAGWQPVTYARASDPSVRIERFGEGKNLYFTVRNDNGKTLNCTILIDKNKLGVGEKFTATELVDSRQMPVSGDKISLSVPSGRTQVIYIAPTK